MPNGDLFLRAPLPPLSGVPSDLQPAVLSPGSSWARFLLEGKIISNGLPELLLHSGRDLILVFRSVQFWTLPPCLTYNKNSGQNGPSCPNVLFASPGRFPCNAPSSCASRSHVYVCVGDACVSCLRLLYLPHTDLSVRMCWRLLAPVRERGTTHPTVPPAVLASAFADS